MRTQVESFSVWVPSDWGMFTSAGNRSLRLKAERLLSDVVKAETFGHRANAFAKYFRGWRKLHGTKTMPESGDTAVREAVWSFAVQVGRQLGWGVDLLDTIWDSPEAQPRRKK